MVRFHYKLYDCCCFVCWRERGQSVITFSFHFRREFMKKAVFSKNNHSFATCQGTKWVHQKCKISRLLSFCSSKVVFFLTFTSCYGHFVEPPCVINQIEFFTNGSKFNFVWAKKNRNWNEKFSFTANLRTSDCPSVTIYAVWWKKKQKCSWKIIIYEFYAAGSLL